MYFLTIICSSVKMKKSHNNPLILVFSPQLNTLQQLENLWTHDVVRDRILAKKLVLHAMWFDVRSGSVFLFSQQRKRYIEVCARELENIEEMVLARK